MMLSWPLLALLLTAGFAAWFWQDSLAARERANAAAIEACQQLGLQCEARGEGKVFKQSPAAGAEVLTGQTIYVDCGRLQ